MKYKAKASFVVLTLFFILGSITPTYAWHFFGWHSNNDCTPLATPDDSINKSACIGGTKSLWIFGIRITTEEEPERYGTVG